MAVYGATAVTVQSTDINSKVKRKMCFDVMHSQLEG